MSQLTLDPARAPRPTKCPDCAAATVNVQGIRTCATCRWVDR